MKTIKYFNIYIIIVVLTIGFVVAGCEALAQGTANVQYPIEELGGCQSEDACRSYCDKPANQGACLDFAKENGMMSEEEVAKAKNFIEAGQKGPGGCRGKDKCEQYCDDINHIDECISYAEKNNLMSEEELQEAKKVQAAINRGVKPPSCSNKKECDVYCEDSNHMEECINFGIAAGFMQGKELEDAQKMLVALKKGVKPLPCKGKDACDQYCSNSDNIESCMNFALEAGFMSEEEKVNAQGMLQAVRNGVKPPPCKGQKECDAYCQKNMEECINFSVAAGMMSKEDAEMARKTGGKGPGGCIGKEECDAFCNNPDNQETCFNFARDNGMISEADLKRMEEGKQQMKQSLQQAPAEVLDCLRTEVGADMVEKMENGVMPPKEMGDKMQTCFQKMGPSEPGTPGEGGMIPPAGQSGPGGCKTADECQKYCNENPDDCKNFQPGPGEINPGDQMMPQQAGPGGCKTPEECNVYCESHQEECKNFYPAGDEGLQGPGPNQQEFQVQSEGQMQPGQPCQGENCQSGPLPGQNILPMQPGQELQPGQVIQPSSEPGSGGNMTPGDAVPLAPPAEQQPQQPAPSETPPPPPPPPSSFLNPESFLGSVLYIIAKSLYSLR